MNSKPGRAGIPAARHRPVSNTVTVWHIGGQGCPPYLLHRFPNPAKYSGTANIPPL
ncbi:hypothetical protein [Neisseria weaveri]|uniref:hypothetical protein n=1 Tax=Neisseria weaveri TaxID=28091 RepID=UPI000A6A65A5|nr:hypothetical protein [Neisseria weaveri]